MSTSTQLVSSERLQAADKILFITHLALGDYTYLQNCFKAFAQAFPQLEIHVWVDELRRTSRAADWVHLKKYALYDWLAACPFVHKVYNQTYSPQGYRQSIADAQQEHYPLVVSLATLRPHRYASLAREICPQGFVVGMKARAGMLAIHKHWSYSKLDAALDMVASQRPGMHISEVYADWFYRLFGLEINAERRFPFVEIPLHWQQQAASQLEQWGFAQGGQGAAKIVFVNAFAKNNKRCWSLDHVADLIVELRQHPAWQEACFIVNSMPEEMARVEAFFAARSLDRVKLFSAVDNFFQLPAILQQCDLIISVETAVMHLANAVQVPVVALMRQKNPEWVPVDAQHSTVITAEKRSDWVKDIPAQRVAETVVKAVNGGAA
ncbi:MAG: glycosyltransferase 9 family protein [Burkholderiaceae bacterium]|nr:glycosyltransferase 9 family protein [Burkholderiaceae bacterium]